MADLKALVPFVLATLVIATPARAENSDPSVCPLVLHEERIDLKEARLEVELARASFATFDEFYGLIAELRKTDAVDRMTYLKVRYDRDSAKVGLERADLTLIRQQALIEHLELACGAGPSLKGAERKREMNRTYERYLRADCDQQAKAIEAAEINLEYNKMWLAGVVDMRDQTSTRLDVMLAELDVTHEERRRDDALRRTEACRAALDEP